jgi:HK97 family phage portal protein
MRGPFAGLVRNASPTTSRKPLTGVGSRFFRPQLPSSSGLRAYGQNSTLFPIVNGLALDTSNATWRLWAPGASGEDDDRTEIPATAHPAAALWSAPNPFMAQAEYVEAGQQHVDLTGEAYSLVVRKGRLPVSLWPIRPDRITPVPDPDKFQIGWIYSAPGGQEYQLAIEDVIQIKMPNPNDPYRGIGPVQAAMVDVDSARYTAEWNRNFFINGAAPDGIIMAESNLDDDDFDRITRRWREAHQGVANAHRVAVLEAGLTFQDSSFSQRDMQFSELRQLSADFIRQAFRYPKIMLGDVQDSNRANSEAAMAMYDANLIDPRLRRWKQMLNNRLLPMFGTNTRGLYFDYDPIVKDDEESEANVINVKVTSAVALVGAGFEADDVLATCGLPPMQFEKPATPEPISQEGGIDEEEPEDGSTDSGLEEGPE